MTEKKYRLSQFSHDERQSSYAEGIMELTIAEIAAFVTKSGWSPSVFKEITTADGDRRMKRGNDFIEEIQVLALDVDGGCTLKEASVRFTGYQAVIATTRNHQKPKLKKSGDTIPACDRFRVIIPLSVPIRSDEHFKQVWAEAFGKWPFIDQACKDVARFFYPSREVVKILEGIPFEVKPYEPSQLPNESSTKMWRQVSSNDRGPRIRGKLSLATLEFIRMGAQPGEWHATLVKAAFDYKQNCYPKDVCIEQLTKAATNATRTLDKEDLFHIHDIYERRGQKYDARKPEEVTLPYNRMTIDERSRALAESQAIQDEAILTSTTFISPEFDGHYRLMMGMTLVAACSGHGKSTSAAHLVHQFITDHPDREVLYVSNEEPAATVLNRIACIDIGLSFRDWRNNKMSQEAVARMKARATELVNQIEVVEKKTHDMTVLEDVQAVLQRASEIPSSVGLIVIDYLQTVHQSRLRPGMPEWEVSKKLGHFLKEYCKKITIPVVVFAQLKPRSESPDVSSRFCNDKTMYHHAVAVVEVKPDFDAFRTEFILHKLRFGSQQGKSVYLKMNTFGQIVPLTEEDLLLLIAEKKPQMKIEKARSDNRSAANSNDASDNKDEE